MSSTPQESGSVSAQGWLDAEQGLSFGVSGTNNGVSLTYGETNSVGTIVFQATPDRARFDWRQGGASASLPKLTLDTNNVLRVFDETGQPTVVIDPANGGSISARTANFGTGSVATGDGAIAWGANNSASGSFATAWGQDNVSSGEFATAFGYQNEASGHSAMALGNFGHAVGAGSTVWGSGGYASGDRATAWGLGCRSTGHDATSWGRYSLASELAATAWGVGNNASGEFTTAWGYYNHATGQGATAWGIENVASGDASIAMGWGNRAVGYGQVAVGTFGDIVPEALLTVGNGASSDERGTAMALLRDARLGIGTVTPEHALSVGRTDAPVSVYAALSTNSAGGLLLARQETGAALGFTRLRPFQDASGFALSANWQQAESQTPGTVPDGARDSTNRCAAQLNLELQPTPEQSYFEMAGGSNAMTSLLRVTLAGRVGVGTAAPQEKLDVAGSVVVRGALRLPPAGDISMGGFTNGPAVSQ